MPPGIRLLLLCGDTPIPVTLPAEGAVAVSAVPTREELAEHLPRAALPERVVVIGGDAALAAVLTYLLRCERLDVEVAFVPDVRTDATRILGLDKGAKAGRRALEGSAHPTPLVRDDLGLALVGTALLTGPEGGELAGETYVDERRLFSGRTTGVRVQPLGEEPGLRASQVGRLRRRWLTGRAAQTGGVAIHVTRDGIVGDKRLKRSTFYRHNVDWLLVR